MKTKLLLLALVLSPILGFSKATLCYGDGSCDEISRVRVGGRWLEACCIHFDPELSGHTSCEDDCGEGVASSNGGEHPYNNILLRSHLDSESNSVFNIWVINGDKIARSHSQSNLLERVKRAAARANSDIEGFEILDENERIVVTINKINLSKFVVGRKNPSQEEKKEIFEKREMSEQKDISRAALTDLSIAPNPASDFVQIEYPEVLKIESIKILDGSNGTLIRNLVKGEFGPAHTRIELGDTISGMVLIFQIKDIYGNTIERKIIKE